MELNLTPNLKLKLLLKMEQLNSQLNFLSKLNCSQLNCDNSKAASINLEKLLSSHEIDIFLAQDVYCSQRGINSQLVPPEIRGYNSLFKCKSNEAPKVVIYAKSKISMTILPQASDRYCITCSLDTGNNVLFCHLYIAPHLIMHLQTD